jgi:hypothetical protein
MAGQKFDPSEEFIKAVIGSAVNVALPGVGSLAVGAVGALTARSLNQELAKALAEAINVVDDTADVPNLALVRRAKGQWRKRKINKALKGSVKFADLRSTSIARFDRAVRETEDDSGAPGGEPKSDDHDESIGQSHDLGRDLRSLALVQLSLAQTEGPVPGTWQDDFEDHLETLARMGLEDPTHGPLWKTVIAGKQTAMPSPARVEEWARLVSEAFAVQIANNADLAPYLARLAEHDKRASERAFLWQLDHQRRAINVVAFFALAIAAEYGLHLVT